MGNQNQGLSLCLGSVGINEMWEDLQEVKWRNGHRNE